MIYWAPFLHFYQPPTQYHSVLQRICKESYRPLIKLFLGLPQAKVTINMCGVLTEMLAQHGGADILQALRSLAQKKQVEFVDSAKYHAILPLIPREEMKRQIRLNRQTNAHFFKDTYKPRGFFPPEMCYSKEVKEVVKSMGYDWILASGIACAHRWPMDFIAEMPGESSAIKIIYRDDILSNKISFRSINSSTFIKQLIGFAKPHKDIYIVTAMDGETFGHHIRHWDQLFLKKVYTIIAALEGQPRKRGQRPARGAATLKQMYKELGDIAPIKAVTISELLKIFPAEKAKPARASSWSTTAADIARKNYYPLWKDRANFIHQLQWRHLDVCIQTVDYILKLPDTGSESRSFAAIARDILDRALHSCQFWWANKERKVWNINLINKGLLLQEEVLLNAVKAINLSSCPAEVKKDFSRRVVAARNMANRIRDVLMAA